MISDKNRYMLIITAALYAAVFSLLLGCAGPSGPDDGDDKKLPPPTPGHYSVMLEAEELGLAALQVFDTGDSGAVALTDLGYPLQFDQVVVALDNAGGYLWNRTLPYGWDHVLFQRPDGYTAVGLDDIDAQFTMVELKITTMTASGGTKRTRTITLPDSLYDRTTLHDAAMLSSGDVLLVGTRYTIDPDGDILDVDGLLARFSADSDEFIWVTLYGSGESSALIWYYFDHLGISADEQTAVAAGRRTEFNEIRGDLELVKFDPETGTLLRNANGSDGGSLKPVAMALNDSDGPLAVVQHSPGGDYELLAFDAGFAASWSIALGVGDVKHMDFYNGEVILSNTPGVEGYPVISRFSSSGSPLGTDVLFEGVAEVLHTAHANDGSWLLAGWASETDLFSDGLSWITRADSLSTFSAPDTVLNVPH
jgi:hypothetical protein